MYKPFRNRLLNWFIGKSRSKSSDNVVVFPRENFPFKRIIKALKKPNIFYYVGDEDLGSKNSTFSNFFAEQKSTIITIAIKKSVDLFLATLNSNLSCFTFFSRLLFSI